MIPSFPSGATLLSLYEASVRIGRFASVQSAMHAAMGRNASINQLFLGVRASDFCRTVLDDAINPSTLLQKHTLFPIFSINLWDTKTEREGHEKITGNQDKIFTSALRQFDCKSYISQRERFCPECTIEDLREYTFPYRRLTHQLITERHCIHHQLELWKVCRCTAKNNKWASIISICPTCKNTAPPINGSTQNNNTHALNILNDILRGVLTDNAPELLIRYRKFSIPDLIDECKETHSSMIKKLLDWLQIDKSAILFDAYKTNNPEADIRSIFLGCWSKSLRLNLVVLKFVWEQLPTSTREQLIPQ